MVRIKSIEEIQNFTCFIRSLRKGLITNFYLNVEKHSIWIETGEFFVHETPECIFFLHENGNFYHLFFTATSTDSLCAALQKASFCNELLSIDILGAKENVVKDALVNIGFYEYKSLYRMYHIGYPLQYEMEKIADMATIKDIDEIYHILNQDFDPLSEQIPTKGELALAISKKEILIFRAESKIKGLILFELSKLNMYLRFWWVDKMYRNQHIGAFLYHSLMNLAKGTKRQMHWVISTNDNAINRYKHYGYIAESLYDYVLLNKKV